MRKYRYLLVMLYASAAMAQPPTDKIDKLMQQFHQYDQFDGVILVAESGKVLYRRAYGIADREWSINNTVDTKFEIASITKTFTALMIMQLYEAGKIDLDEKMIRYLNDYPSETGAKITVRQLLMHRSGLQVDIADFPPSGNNFPDIAAKINEEFLSLKEQVDLIARRPLLFEPGTRFSYSSDGYSVLGRIIEVVTAMSYEHALDSLMIKPLGLKNTGYKNHYAIIGKRATGYKEKYDGYEKGRQFGIAPSGGMYSTVDDLFTWEQALYTDKLISQKSKDIIFRKTSGITNYGWKVNENFFGTTAADSVKVVKCTGALPGFNALVVRFPRDHKTIIILENVRRITYRHDEIAQSVANILYNKQTTSPKKSLARAMLSASQESGTDGAMKLFRAFKDNSAAYYLSEAEMNSIGYYLLYTLGNINAAIEFFKVNTVQFPQSSNVYDSLGEAYMVLGDKENAMINYTKSLELNPNNTNAVEMIRKLKE
ncbi:MAG TPA: serine hydrolase [Chryseosolibacter sp.]|nr:serine hydrolase [Chryseosolibacter sp.]